MTNEEIFRELRKTSPDISGVGTSRKITKGVKTDIPCITIFVNKKKPKSELRKGEIIPREIGNRLTDVVQATFNALPLLALKPMAVWEEGGDRTLKYRPAPGGISVGHKDISAGTLGGWVYKESKRCILSNNHVLCNVNLGEVGDSIYQPGPYDGGVEADRIAGLLDWEVIILSPPEPNDSTDCAIAEVDNIDNVDLQIADLTQEVKYIGSPVVGMETIKSGRTTAITEGPVDIIDLAIDVNYGEGYGIAHFVNLVGMAVDDYIYGGDSGSWCLQKKEDGDPDTILGLLFAGTAAGWGIAMLASKVFELLDITLVAPINLKGTITAGGLPAQGAYVLAYNLNTSELHHTTTNELGEYELTPGHKDEVILVSVHFTTDEVYQAASQLTLKNSPDETLNFTLETYDAVANGQTVDFRMYGLDWLIADLNLRKYVSVWY